MVCLHEVVNLEENWDYHIRIIKILAKYMITRVDLRRLLNDFSGNITTFSDNAIMHFPNYKSKVSHMSSSWKWAALSICQMGGRGLVRTDESV